MKQKQTPEQVILTALVNQGVKQIDLAKKFGVTPSWINQVIKGHRHNPELRDKICRELGIKNPWR